MRKKWILAAAGRWSCVAALATLLPMTGAQATVVINAPFDGSYNTNHWQVSGNAPKVVAAPKPICSGSGSLEVLLDGKNSTVKYRTEFTLKKTAFPLPFGQDRWFGFSLYLPGDAASGWGPDKWDSILFQIHSTPDDWNAPGRNPNMTLRFDPSTQTWRASVKGEPTVGTYKTTQFNLGAVKKNAWTNFVVQYNPHATGGKLGIWVNGAKLVNYTGTSAFRDKETPYAKMGNYTPAWNPTNTWSGGPDLVSRRVHYVDAFKAGDASSSYAQVAPTCATTAPAITVRASSYVDPHKPINTLDGSTNTRWQTNDNGQWIEYDLKSRKAVDAIRIAWYQGDQYRYKFDVQVSNDKTNWTNVLLGKTSNGDRISFETHSLGGVQARYVRIVSRGYTAVSGSTYQFKGSSITKVEFRTQ